MQNRTGFAGLGLKDRGRRFLAGHRRQAMLLCSLAAGYVMASSRMFGGISPFGVAFCATLPAPYAMLAAFGSILGYTVSAGPLSSMKYLVAVALVAAVKWLFGGRFGEKHTSIVSAATTLVSLGVAGAAVLLTGGYTTLYDWLQFLAELLLGAGAAYFFSRSLQAARAGWGGVNRADISCLIVSMAVVVMGFSGITLGGLSVGRIAAVVIVLLSARAGGEAGGSVAGLTAGIAMGLTGGDYAYAISAYGFGGLMAGVFSGVGRVPAAAAFIVVNAVAALATQQSGAVFSSLVEIFVASVIFSAVPGSAVSRLRRVGAGGARADPTAQAALCGRLEEVAAALSDIGATTKEVSKRLGKQDGRSLSDMCGRVADRVCAHCGLKTTCWQFQYTDTMNAMNDAVLLLRRDGSLNRDSTPRHFLDKCCRLEEMIAELNTQFNGHVARENARRRVSRVRGVIADQFEGIAMMLDDIAREMGGVTLLEPAVALRAQDYFQKAGIEARQVRCYHDEFERISTEVILPLYQVARLDAPQAALDLSSLLDAEFDLPHVARHSETATAVFTEKATYVAELGVHQIAPEGNRLCGDAYASIHNLSGRAHFILSDGMGSGGGAAVEAGMTCSLLSRLIEVGFSHEAALKMINSALLIKSGEESLATVDICTLDLYTGRADFYKAGAAPTFVVRGGKAGFVQSTSLPAGILQGVTFDKSGFSLRESDVVVMVSDGVTATGEEWIKSELEAGKRDNMQHLAEKLAMTAKLRRSDDREDDITVLAIALRKGV